MKEIIDLAMDKEIQTVDINPLIEALTSMRSKDYWISKNIRLSNLDNNEFIAYELTKATLGFSMEIQELIGILVNKISKGIPFEEKLKNAVDVIHACNGIHYCIDQNLRINSNYQLESETYALIKLHNEYMPPLKCMPQPWESNVGGGYFTRKDHCILGSIHNRHNLPQALDVLNKLQSVALTLDEKTIAQEQHPNKPFKSPDSHKQFIEFKEKSKELYQEYLGIPWHLQWRFDKRGRMYSSGYMINIQGSGYQKASINLAVEELI